MPRRNDGEMDLVVVGGGSAGFAAATRAAELGAGVAIVEAGTLGGTCVNVGCIPSKTLIRAAEAHSRPTHHGFAGMRAETTAPEFRAVVAQKDALVTELRKAKYEDVLRAYPSIDVLRGRAHLLSDGALEIEGRRLLPRRIVLATGASAAVPPIPGLAGVPFLTSTSLMELQEIPRRLVVIGGGAVGLELAQAFARFGSRVTVLEALPRVLPAEDPDVGEELAEYLRQDDLDVRTGVTVTGISGLPGRYEVEIDQAARRTVIEGDQILVATGRAPNTRGIGLEEAGITLGAKGEVIVDEHLETLRPGVYAAGDVVGEPMFVYVAAFAGAVAAENALGGNRRKYDLGALPRVTFTDPAVASVGLTEAEARRRGVAVAVSKLPLTYVPRALAARDTRGFIKLVADAGSGLLVGAHILAPEAGETIQAAAMAIAFGIRVEQIAAMVHPYLTHAEGIKLASQAFKKDVAKLSCCAA